MFPGVQFWKKNAFGSLYSLRCLKTNNPVLVGPLGQFNPGNSASAWYVVCVVHAARFEIVRLIADNAIGRSPVLPQSVYDDVRMS